MKKEFGRRFLEAFDRLPAAKKHSATEAIELFLRCLEHHVRLPIGLGLKKIDRERNYWELRSTLADRIVFEWTGDVITFKLIGSHDDVRKFLRSN